MRESRGVLPALGSATLHGSGSARGGTGHEDDEVAVELGGVEVDVDGDEMFAEAGIVAGGPGEGVAVRCAVVNGDVEIKFFGAGDDGGIEPGNCGELVPHVFRVAVFGDVLGDGRFRLSDFGEHFFCEARLDGNVHGRVNDAGPVRVEHGVGGFGVHPEIEFTAWTEAKFGVVCLRIDAAAHNDEFLGEGGEMRVNGDGEGKVGERAAFVNCDLMRIAMDHADHEVRGVFVRGLGGWRAFDEGRNFVWAVSFAGRPVPGALIHDFAIERFPAGDEFLAVVEREDGAGDDGNVRAADDFEHAQGVGDFFVAPLVAGDDGDAEDVGLRRLNQRED